MRKNMSRRRVNLRIASPSFLVVELSLVSDARQDQPVADSFGSFLISGKLCNRPNRARNEQELIRVTKILSRKKLCEESGNSNL